MPWRLTTGRLDRHCNISIQVAHFVPECYLLRSISYNLDAQSSVMKKTAPLLWLVVATLSTGVAANATTMVVGQQQIRQLEAQAKPLIASLLTLDMAAIEHELKRFNRPQQLWLRKSLIEAIAKQSTATQPQLNWLLSQVDNEQKMLMTMPESGHAKPIVIANIAAKAKAQLAHFRAIETAQHWLSQVRLGTFNWQTLLEQSVTLRRHNTAWRLFLHELDPSTFDPLSDELLQRAKAHHDIPNRLLLMMARRSKDNQQKVAFYQLLWTKPSDENSIDGLNRLMADDALTDPTAQFKAASQNPALTSLAFNLLAKHFGDERQIQQWLFSKLSDVAQSPFAAAALARIDDDTVKQQLLQGRYSPDKTFSQACRLAVTIGALKESDQ